MGTEKISQTSLMVNNDTAQLSLVRDFVKDGIRIGGFPEENTNRIMVAVDEAITNVLNMLLPECQLVKAKFISSRPLMRKAIVLL